MNYYTTPTDSNILSIRYLYYEYESDLEVYEINVEDLSEETNINITGHASI